MLSTDNARPPVARETTIEYCSPWEGLNNRSYRPSVRSQFWPPKANKFPRGSPIHENDGYERCHNCNGVTEEEKMSAPFFSSSEQASPSTVVHVHFHSPPTSCTYTAEKSDSMSGDNVNKTGMTFPPFGLPHDGGSSGGDGNDKRGGRRRTGRGGPGGGADYHDDEIFPSRTSGRKKRRKIPWDDRLPRCVMEEDDDDDDDRNTRYPGGIGAGGVAVILVITALIVYFVIKQIALERRRECVRQNRPIPAWVRRVTGSLQ